jgi:hypothetical protein
VSETISVTFKFNRGDTVRDTSWHEERIGKVATRSYYESDIPNRSKVQYAVVWPDGGFTVPISEDCLELVEDEQS